MNKCELYIFSIDPFVFERTLGHTSKDSRYLINLTRQQNEHSTHKQDVFTSYTVHWFYANFQLLIAASYKCRPLKVVVLSKVELISFQIFVRTGLSFYLQHHPSTILAVQRVELAEGSTLSVFPSLPRVFCLYMNYSMHWLSCF